MQLNEVLTGYSAWDRPWEFPTHIQKHLDLSSTDKDKFSNIWKAATDATHWQSSDIVLGCKSVQSSLSVLFPYLNEEAIGNIVRAVSYQWR
jgi:hypothetical protein